MGTREDRQDQCEDSAVDDTLDYQIEAVGKVRMLPPMLHESMVHLFYVIRRRSVVVIFVDNDDLYTFNISDKNLSKVTQGLDVFNV